MLCLHVCVTEARTIVTWLTEQAKSLLNVNSAYLSVVCLHAVGCLSKDYSCLAHGTNRGSSVCAHVCCDAGTNITYVFTCLLQNVINARCLHLLGCLPIPAECIGSEGA